MDLQVLLWAACPHCNGKLAFDTHAANRVIACPHCGKSTLLSLTQLMLSIRRNPAPTPDPQVVADEQRLDDLKPAWLNPLRKRVLNGDEQRDDETKPDGLLDPGPSPA